MLLIELKVLFMICLFTVLAEQLAMQTGNKWERQSAMQSIIGAPAHLAL